MSRFFRGFLRRLVAECRVSYELRWQRNKRAEYGKDRCNLFVRTVRDVDQIIVTHCKILRRKQRLWLREIQIENHRHRLPAKPCHINAEGLHRRNRNLAVYKDTPPVSAPVQQAATAAKRICK